MLAELRTEVARGAPRVDRQTTVGDLLLAWLAIRKEVVGSGSYVRYETLIRLQLAGVHRIPASALTPEDVRAHLRSLTKSPATIKAALLILRSALALAERDGVVQRNVASQVAAPRRTPRPATVLDDAQSDHLLEVAATDVLYPLWAVMVGSGLRMGEALGLRRPDLDLDLAEPRVTVSGSLRHQSVTTRGTGLRLQRVEPKTAAGRRVVPLTPRAAAALRQMPQDAVYVFHRGHGRPLNPSTVQRAFAALVKLAGLPPMRLHDLRHSWVTRLLAHGATLDDVKRAAGHSSIAVTSDIYGHLVEARLRDFINRLDKAAG